MRASPSSARTPAQPVRRAACAHNASPQSPATRALLVARVGAGAASPARRRRVLSKRRARASLPPSARHGTHIRATWSPSVHRFPRREPRVGACEFWRKFAHAFLSVKVSKLKPHPRLFCLMISFIRYLSSKICTLSIN